MRGAPIRRKGTTEASTIEPDSCSVTWALLQLTISNLKTRCIAGFALSAIAILSILVIQFAATIPNVAYDGCARVGFPVVFFDLVAWLLSRPESGGGDFFLGYAVSIGHSEFRHGVQN